MTLCKLKNFHACECRLAVNERRLGLNRNTLATLMRAFHLKADHIVHLEDDTVPSPDALRYYEWGIDYLVEHDPKHTILLVSGYNKPKSKPTPEQSHHCDTRPVWTPWGWRSPEKRWGESSAGKSALWCAMTDGQASVIAPRNPLVLDPLRFPTRGGVASDRQIFQDAKNLDRDARRYRRQGRTASRRCRLECTSSWGHVTAPAPIAVNGNVYFVTMIGTVYVVDANAKVFDATAIKWVGDLGPAGQTWTLASLSYANGRIYARTLKEVVCIGQ